MRESEKSNERFNYTDLMELPKYHAVVRVVMDGEPQQPVLGKLELSKWDKKRNMAKGRKNTGNLKIEVPKSETESSKINIKIDVKINERVEVTKDQESDNNDFFDI
jgi:hypothetical protein